MSSERAKRLQHKGTRLTTVILSLEFCISMLINLYISSISFYTCGLTAVIKTNMVRYFFLPRGTSSRHVSMCVCLSVTG